MHNRQKLRVRTKAALAAVALLVVGVVFHVPLLVAAGEWLSIGQPPCMADSIYVLPGDETTRPFLAAQLMRDGYAPHVLVPDAVQSAEQARERGMSIQDSICRILVAQGVPERAITRLPHADSSTFDDAQTLRRYLLRQEPATVIVVTNDYHTRRARWVFDLVFDDLPHQLRWVSIPAEGAAASNWWRSAEGRRFYLSEYVKLPYYVIRYGNGTYVIVVCVAAVPFLIWLRRRISFDRTAEPRGSS